MHCLKLYNGGAKCMYVHVLTLWPASIYSYSAWDSNICCLHCVCSFWYLCISMHIYLLYTNILYKHAHSHTHRHRHTYTHTHIHTYMHVHPHPHTHARDFQKLVKCIPLNKSFKTTDFQSTTPNGAITVLIMILWSVVLCLISDLECLKLWYPMSRKCTWWQHHHGVLEWKL